MRLSQSKIVYSQFLRVAVGQRPLGLVVGERLVLVRVWCGSGLESGLHRLDVNERALRLGEHLVVREHLNRGEAGVK